MKRLIVTISLLFTLLNFSFAQNTFPSSGNVGIGTTSPVTPLDIGGNLTLENNQNVPNAGAVLHFTSLGTAYPGPPIKSSLQMAGANVYNNLILSSYWNGYKNEITLQNGNVGIGTSTPSSTLHVMGTFTSAGSDANLGYANVTNFLANTGQVLIGWNRTYGSGETDFIANQGAGSTGGFAFYNHDNSNNETQLMWIQGSGNILIGRTSQLNTSYKLDVNGNMHANQVVINSTGADFVFAPTYHLNSLANVKKYIDKNHHLPELASAKEMQAKGLNVGDTETKLLQKVEELTLYLIDKDNELAKQKRVNSAQNARLEVLEKQIELIKKKLK